MKMTPQTECTLWYVCWNKYMKPVFSYSQKCFGLIQHLVWPPPQHAMHSASPPQNSVFTPPLIHSGDSIIADSCRFGKKKQNKWTHSGVSVFFMKSSGARLCALQKPRKSHTVNLSRSHDEWLKDDIDDIDTSPPAGVPLTALFYWLPGWRNKQFWISRL